MKRPKNVPIASTNIVQIVFSLNIVMHAIETFATNAGFLNAVQSVTLSFALTVPKPLLARDVVTGYVRHAITVNVPGSATIARSPSVTDAIQLIYVKAVI